MDREVPFNVTSNQVAARQNAQMVLESLALQNLEPATPIRVLELASGLGMFGLNFIKAFEALCQERQLDYFERFEFWMTDFSIKTLEKLASNSFYQAQIQAGRLKLFHFDAIEGQTLTDLDGKVYQLADFTFSAFIANYHHCTLPMALLLYKQGRFMEVEVESFGWLAGTPSRASELAERQQVMDQIAYRLKTCQLPVNTSTDLLSCLQKAIQHVSELMVQDAVVQNWSAELNLKACLIRMSLEKFDQNVLYRINAAKCYAKLNQVDQALDHFRELVVKSLSDTSSATDRQRIQGEIDKIVLDTDRLARNTIFNSRNLLDGSLSGMILPRNATAEIESNATLRNSTGASFDF